jgi:small-conductance mechanosensitive channel
MSETLAPWLPEWIVPLAPASRLLLIIACAWLLRKMLRALIARLGKRAILPPELVVGLRRLASVVITTGAVLLVLDQIGVSATVLWTALTGFVAVAAIAFFAAWSVLSNIFCAFLIFITRPFRMHDYIEILENGEKPGLRGQVVDINVVYTTLRDTTAGTEPGAVLQIPNSLFFQRAVRRWRGAAASQAQIGDG